LRYRCRLRQRKRVFQIESEAAQAGERGERGEQRPDVGGSASSSSEKLESETSKLARQGISVRMPRKSGSRSRAGDIELMVNFWRWV
jgi:hypothetical protein